jgi:hypothetical protein
MTPKGPRRERETVINFNEEDETATIWTASGPMDKRFRKLGLEVIEEGERKASLSNRMRLARQDQAITTAKKASRGILDGSGNR